MTEIYGDFAETIDDFRFQGFWRILKEARRVTVEMFGKEYFYMLD